MIGANIGTRATLGGAAGPLAAAVAVAAVAAAAVAAAVVMAVRMVPGKSRTATVLVLGDMGHSPRMQNHVLALAQNGFAVSFVGFDGSPVRPEIAEHPAVRLVHLPQPARMTATNKLGYALQGLWRSIRQAVGLFSILLWHIPKPEFLLVQNPPAIPTLAVAQCVSVIQGCRLIIDWHNFGFSLMPPRITKNALMLAILQRYEQWLGRWASLHLCVTESMAAELIQRWNVWGEVVVVYDRPPSHFAPISTTQIHDLFCRLDLMGQDAKYRDEPARIRETILTHKSDAGIIEMRRDRPAVIISSTSWTPDEDFSLLFGALQEYDAEVDRRLGHSSSSPAHSLPNLLIIITGRGPLKDIFAKQVRESAMSHVLVKFAWLKPQDYPLMVATADLGVSLHTSSSGLDLPMKIIDMFGCGVPVCSYFYPCISELVKDGENGVHFRTAPELCDVLSRLLEGFPAPNATLGKLCAGAAKYREQDWKSYWDTSVLPKLQ